MDSAIGKITSKGRITIPASLRKKLQLQGGDKLMFRKKGDQIIIEKLNPIDIEYYRAVQGSVASEWNTQEDNKTFRKL